MVRGCAELIELHDWVSTPLGPRKDWPASLRATVANTLAARQPLLLFWGPELIQIYNDAFVPSFGFGKHPSAMGQPARICWADAWPVVGAQIEAVMTRGEPFWFEDALVPILRNGRMEEVFWTYSYSPAHDDDGRIAGALVIVTETTGRVLDRRRLSTLAALGRELSRATTLDAVHDTIGGMVSRASTDIPFLVVDHPTRPRLVGIDAARAASVIAALRACGDGTFAIEPGIPSSLWPEPVTHAFAAPVGEYTVAFGLSPRLPFDASYRELCLQLIDRIASALRRVDTIGALQLANRTKDEFLAMLGHELRNPLAPIVTALQLMHDKDHATTRERAVIERQVRHVVRLVDDLLDISRITRGMLVLDRGIVELSDAIAAAIDAAAHLIAQRGHRLIVDLQPGVKVAGDEARLVQIVSNLIVNAARYTPNGGEIRVVLAADAGTAVLRVIDSGAGIEPELLPRVFEMFVQGTRSSDRAEGGLGLGLAIVKNLVQLHGGSVEVHSDGPDRGSTFTVRLPIAAAPPSPAPRPQRRVAASSARRVLVVDDNEDAANLLGEIIRLRGHHVEIVHHPDAALTALERFAPELALLDIGLPGMDGYELAQRLRATHPEIRLIALTGYGQASDRERALAAGFAAHLVKPVKIDELLALIAS